MIFIVIASLLFALMFYTPTKNSVQDMNERRAEMYRLIDELYKERLLFQLADTTGERMRHQYRIYRLAAELKLIELYEE